MQSAVIFVFFRPKFASCQVLYKFRSQSEASATILVFRSARKRRTWEGTLRSFILSSFVKFRSAVFFGEVENISANKRPGDHLCFQDRPEKHKLGRGRWVLSSCQILSNSVQRFPTRSRKCLSKYIRSQGGHLGFPIDPKNTNLLKDVEILLPVKCRQILISDFRGDVQNVSANQRTGRQLGFPIGLKKHKLGRGRWYLTSS